MLVAQGLLHVTDVMGALANVVADVTVLANFVTQKAIESGTGFKKASILSTLAHLGANSLSEASQSSIVGSDCELLVLDSEFRSDCTLSAGEHFLFNLFIT